MVFTTLTPIWISIPCFIGLAIGFLSSCIVMISLMKLPFRDASTELRKYSTISDMIISIPVVALFFVTENDGLCYWTYLFLFSLNSHAYWVLYMSYVMRKIIYLQREHEKKDIKFGYVICVAISAGLSGIIFSRRHADDQCFNFEDSIYFFIFDIALQEIIILILILLFYYQIRKALISEIEKYDDCCSQKKIIFSRLYGYPLIFSLISIQSIFIFIQIFITEAYTPAFYIRVVILSFYPLLNSIFYGMTQSSKRILKYLINKNFQYPKEEEILDVLRTRRMIPPRIYYEITNKPEDDIFK